MAREVICPFIFFSVLLRWNKEAAAVEVVVENRLMREFELDTEEGTAESSESGAKEIGLKEI